MQKPPRRLVYLLRCWEERAPYHHPNASWRFLLEDPRTGHRQGFASLDELTDFIRVTLSVDDQGSDVASDSQPSN